MVASDQEMCAEIAVMKAVIGARKITAAARKAAGQRSASIRRIVNCFQSMLRTSFKADPPIDEGETIRVLPV